MQDYNTCICVLMVQMQLDWTGLESGCWLHDLGGMVLEIGGCWLHDLDGIVLEIGIMEKERLCKLASMPRPFSVACFNCGRM